MLKNKKVFILGMAKSGFEAAKLLAEDNKVLVTDLKEQDIDNVNLLKELNVEVIISDDPLSLLDSSFDLVIKNPGIKYNHPVIAKARELNIDVINEMELAFLYLKTKPIIIGVTGSNGKTTTSTLIYEILKAAKKSVYLGGNIGFPFSGFVDKVKDNDLIVMEISDHQLCDMYSFKTDVSILTNIYDVHTDFHDSHKKYVETKKKIFNNHTNNDIAIVNMDNEEAYDLSKDINSKKLYFSKNSKQFVYLKDNGIYYKDSLLINCNEIKIKGVHNYENIMAAIACVKLFEVSDDAIREVLKNFAGVEHRIEYVDTINGVSYYNDSKATNCDSTITALKSFDSPILLILGGLDRHHSFEPLKDSMKNVKYVACYGETKNRIYDFCKSVKKDCEIFDNLHDALNSCKNKAVSGDIVLLSPACAAWDQYDNFEVRGKEFKNIIKSFKED